jgi:hypothetical protein
VGEIKFCDGAAIAGSRAGQEVVLGGWTFEGKTVRSLLAGVYRSGELLYAAFASVFSSASAFMK